ncbi:NAD(P)H dehydrogenase (quinone) [Bifidobacterium bohemicum]|uniref:NAD(P)H dehydrogenase (Quinone) n=1 Tax=Bifidobacterium bohemicum DSM 22767 TaxID=1437606 RepID=A0A086ZEU8_9BIFI|nr:NAD(P)H-dependent oxidoreductase [Bifidobacterium bohemicum]KFI45048.1 NAD(P)H dehydrogenase (quinone) [Bifidobacterium bohemicum DSM 22767]SCB92800.1 NAD(P)H dehydrogenase (quinone) [Bifidobacterium bohemicum]
MTKVLAITDNPEEHSLTNALGAAFLKGAKAEGAETDMIDLHGIGFNPVFGAEDRSHYLGKAPMPADLVPIQRKLDWADVVALVFPVYWFGMPAMMKGFLDRVLCRGYAFAGGAAMQGKRFHIMATAGGAKEWYDGNGLIDKLEHLICKDVLTDYLGVASAGFTMFYDVDSGREDEASKAIALEYIERATNEGRVLARA